MFFVIALYAIFAAVYPVCKIAFNNYIEPLFFTGICLLLAGVILLLYRLMTDTSKLIIKKIHVIPLLVLIICNIYLTNTCERWGLQYLTATKTCFIYNLCPLFSAIVSYVWLSEIMTVKKWLGFLIGFLGFIPFFIEKSAIEHNVGGFFFCSWPELALIGAAISTVIGWISMRKLVLLNFCPLAANGLSMLVGSILVLLSSWLFGESWNPMPVRDWGHASIFIFLATFISYILAYNMYGSILSRYTATFVTMVGLSSPLFTAFFGWLLLGEQVSWTFAVSMVMVSIGIFLFHQDELRPQVHSQDMEGS